MRIQTVKDFDTIINFILEMEGHYSVHPDDPGGETKFGISKKAYPKLDIKTITLEHAKGIYYSDYWLTSLAPAMPGKLRLVYMDAAVNQGIFKTDTMLKDILGTKMEGKIGPDTLRKAHSFNEKGLVVEFLRARSEHYRKLKNWDVFGRGWMNRLFKVAIESGEGF